MQGQQSLVDSSMTVSKPGVFPQAAGQQGCVGVDGGSPWDTLHLSED